jgi:hypothetical protein
LFCIVPRCSHRVCMSCGQITQQVRLLLKFIITVDVLYMCMTGLHASVSLTLVIGTEHHRWQHACEYQNTPLSILSLSLLYCCYYLLPCFLIQEHDALILYQSLLRFNSVLTKSCGNRGGKAGVSSMLIWPRLIPKTVLYSVFFKLCSDTTHYNVV